MGVPTAPTPLVTETQVKRADEAKALEFSWGACDRPWAQHDTRSYGAAGGIFDVLAIYDGISMPCTCDHEASHQQRRSR